MWDMGMGEPPFSCDFMAPPGRRKMLGARLPTSVWGWTFLPLCDSYNIARSAHCALRCRPRITFLPTAALPRSERPTTHTATYHLR